VGGLAASLGAAAGALFGVSDIRIKYFTNHRTADRICLVVAGAALCKRRVELPARPRDDATALPSART
jgi:hypothetical protein